MKSIELDFDVASVHADVAKKKPVLTDFVGHQQLNYQLREGQNIKLLRRINDLPHINSSFRSINNMLENGAVLEGKFNDCNAENPLTQMHLPFVRTLSKSIDFLVHRVAPKTRFLDSAYQFITKGKNKRISKAEVLGRLVYCGFEIESITEENNEVHFKARKVAAPMKDQKVSGGWFYAMPRVGKNGKIIRVYKLRTMHPYSEFIQTYLKEKQGYDSTGKIKDDFRVTKWGKFIRKYWLDELPQLINVFKGEMKLVGVRPVSMAYFKDLPEETQQLRIQSKPGCIPPYVAMNRKSSVEGVLEAERDYLKACSTKRFADLCFFCSALYHIVITGKRSA